MTFKYKYKYSKIVFKYSKIQIAFYLTPSLVRNDKTIGRSITEQLMFKLCCLVITNHLFSFFKTDCTWFLFSPCSVASLVILKWYFCLSFLYSASQNINEHFIISVVCDRTLTPLPSLDLARFHCLVE